MSSTLNEHRPTPAKGLRMTYPMISLQPLQSNLLSGRDRSGTPYTTSVCQMALTFKPSTLVNLLHKPGTCSTRSMPGGHHHWQDPTGGHPDHNLGPPGYGLVNQCAQQGQDVRLLMHARSDFSKHQGSAVLALQPPFRYLGGGTFPSAYGFTGAMLAWCIPTSVKTR